MAQNEIKQYSLNFKGYWREKNKGGVPAESGIYMVYRCVYNSASDSVRLIDIIYIGQSEDVRNRLATHDKYSAFVSQLQPNEELCYAFSPVAQRDLDIVENALVYAQKPILNDDLKEHFNYGSVAIKADGRCSGLKYTDYKIS